MYVYLYYVKVCTLNAVTIQLYTIHLRLVKLVKITIVNPHLHLHKWHSIPLAIKVKHLTNTVVIKAYEATVLMPPSTTPMCTINIMQVIVSITG